MRFTLAIYTFTETLEEVGMEVLEALTVCEAVGESVGSFQKIFRNEFIGNFLEGITVAEHSDEACRVDRVTGVGHVPES